MRQSSLILLFLANVLLVLGARRNCYVVNRFLGGYDTLTLSARAMALSMSGGLRFDIATHRYEFSDSSLTHYEPKFSNAAVDNLYTGETSSAALAENRKNYYATLDGLISGVLGHYEDPKEHDKKWPKEALDFFRRYAMESWHHAHWLELKQKTDSEDAGPALAIMRILEARKGMSVRLRDGKITIEEIPFHTFVSRQKKKGTLEPLTQQASLHGLPNQPLLIEKFLDRTLPDRWFYIFGYERDGETFAYYESVKYELGCWKVAKKHNFQGLAETFIHAAAILVDPGIPREEPKFSQTLREHPEIKDKLRKSPNDDQWFHIPVYAFSDEQGTAVFNSLTFAREKDPISKYGIDWYRVESNVGNLFYVAQHPHEFRPRVFTAENGDNISAQLEWQIARKLLRASPLLYRNMLMPTSATFRTEDFGPLIPSR